MIISGFRRKVLLALVLSVPALLLLVAPAGAQAPLVKVKIGSPLSPPAMDWMALYVAVEKGFFKTYGLDVQVAEFRGDGIQAKALMAGEVDLSVMGATAAIVSASKGAKIRLFVVPHPTTAYHFVARKDAGATVQALVGKTVAVAGIGTISYHIPRIVLERSGVDPEKLKYVAVGSPADRFKALVAGKADAAVLGNIEVAKLANYPEIAALVNVPKVVPEIPYGFGIAKEEFIEKNPETIYKLTRALIEANRWILANKAGTVEVATKVIKGETADVLGAAYDLTDPRLWGVNGDLSEEAYKFTVDFLVKVGHMKDPIPIDKFFDRRFVDRALKELGRM